MICIEAEALEKIKKKEKLKEWQLSTRLWQSDDRETLHIIYIYMSPFTRKQSGKISTNSIFVHFSDIKGTLTLYHNLVVWRILFIIIEQAPLSFPRTLCLYAPHRSNLFCKSDSQVISVLGFCLVSLLGK